MNPIVLLRPSPLALLACLALSVAVCPAQDKSAATTITAGPHDPHAISIDFPGGPFSQLAASLKGDRLSIVQSAGVDPVLPPFSVTDAQIPSVIVALGRIVEPQGYVLDVTGPNVAVLMRRPDHSSRDFGSFQLENKIGERKAEDVIAAIQQGCEFFNEGRPSTLRFKYHPATKLLFVAGTESEVNVAHRVFASLPDNPPKAGTPAPDKK
ncbi:MAG TPA: hypothetical protein VG734_05315 [Lacunisphaera sp.]|nr:hypothetical protein [Lacunisphaera sp.]